MYKILRSCCIRSAFFMGAVIPSSLLACALDVYYNMKASKPFTFILHLIGENQHITDITVNGVAYCSFGPHDKIEYLNYSIGQIILEADDITNVASCVDMQQINNACFAFAQTLFAEDLQVANDLLNFPASKNIFFPAIAS